MPIQQEIWVSTIKENLYKNIQFVRLSTNHDQYVLAGKVVHIPNAGAKPTVVKNRTSFPATTVQRTDADLTYNLDVFSTDPTHIIDADKVELSYDKIMSVLSGHLETLQEGVSDEVLYNWANGLATANMISTTGDAVAAHLDGATGNRKIVVLKNLKQAQVAMNKQNIPKGNRYALFDSEMLGQLQDDPDLKKRDYAQELDMKNGVITRLFGFDVIERSDVIRLTADNVLAPETANAAGSNAGVFCWHTGSVAAALGEVQFFERLNDPQYYGDVYSALLRSGGRRTRSDNKGVIIIRQAPAA